MNGKLRLSYTLLRLWMDGKEDEIVPCYLRLETKMTSAIQKGKDFDKYVEEFVTKNKKFPPELGGKELDPLVKSKFIVETDYNDLFTLKGELDILNKDEIIEIKCSAGQDAGDFSETLQLPFYFLLCDTYHNLDLGITKGWIYRYDPLKKLYDTALVWKTQRHIEEARQAIEKYGPEIHKYLLEEGVL